MKTGGLKTRTISQISRHSKSPSAHHPVTFTLISPLQPPKPQLFPVYLTQQLKMTTDNEKLCMAIISNSAVTSINWPGVGAALGLKINSAQKRWKRFRDASEAEKSTKSQPAELTENVKASKKRGVAEVGGGEEEAVRRLPARQARGKRVKIEASESDEDDAERVSDGKDPGEEDLYNEKDDEEV